MAQVSFVMEPQLSDIVGFGTLTKAEQLFTSLLFVIFAGQLITGGWVSMIVTRNEQVALLLARSLAIYVIVVTPTLNVRVPT